MSFLVGSGVKNPPVNAGDSGLIPESTHSIILACEISWTEESGRLQSTLTMGSQSQM